VGRDANLGDMERYEDPSDDVLAWFSAHGVALEPGQRWKLAQLEVIEGSDGLLHLWAALSGSVNERIQAVAAIQDRRGLEAWRLETNHLADKEAMLRAGVAERRRHQEHREGAREDQRQTERKAKAARDKRWTAFEQAKAQLAKEWGRGAWGTLEADLLAVAWEEWSVKMTVRQAGAGTARKAAFLSAAMSEILGSAFRVEIVAAERQAAPAQI